MQVGHPDLVRAVAWSPDGKSLASLGDDGALRLWDVAGGQTRRELRAAAALTSVAWMPGGRLLAAGGQDGTVRFYDPAAGTLLREVKGDGLPITSLSWSPDGKTVAAAGWVKTIRLWDPATGQLRRALENPANGVQVVAWAPDGLALAAAGADGVIRLWDPATGQLLRELRGHSSMVAGLAWSADGTRLASGGWDHTVRVWDRRTGQSTRTWTLAADARPGGVRPPPPLVQGVTWSPDGRWVIAVPQGGPLRRWDATTGEAGAPLAPELTRVASVAWSPDGKTLAIGAGAGVIRLADAAGSRRGDLAGTGSLIDALAWSPDGKTLASGSSDGSLLLWDPATGQARGGMRPPGGMIFGLAWRPDGKVLASVGTRITARSVSTVQLLDPTSGATLRELNDSGVLGAALAWSPDGKTLAAANQVGDDRVVRLWDAEDDLPPRRLGGHSDSVTSLAWSPDGKALASGARNGEVRLWDLRTGVTRHTLKAPGGWATALAWSPDGGTLAAAGLEGQVLLCDPATGETRRTLPAPGTPVRALAWSPDGKHLAAGGQDGVCRVWEAAGGTLRQALRGHSGPIRALAWSPDGGRLASGSWDGSVRVWPGAAATPGRPVALIGSRSERGFDWLAVTAEGYYDASPGGAERVSWRVGADLFPAARFEGRYHRPGLVRRALAGEPLAQATLSAADVPPSARLVTPVGDPVVREAAIDVEVFGADDRAVTDVEVFLNGRPLPPELPRPILIGSKGTLAYGQPLPDGARPILIGAKPILIGAKALPDRHRVYKTFRLRVPLPPGLEPVTLRAVVYDDQGYNSEPAEIVLRRSGAPDPQGTLYALCVGVSEYASPQFNLKFAARDAEAVAALLAGQTGLYRDVRVTRLLDRAATGNAVRAALAAIGKQATPADTVILFLSGHGVEDAQGRYCFATHEVAPAALAKTTLTAAQLQALLGPRVRARGVFLFADTCHSGKIPAHPADNNRLAALRTVVVASSQGGEYSFEKEEWGHGAFTLALLEALEGKADPAAPVVRFSSLLDYVTRRVEELLGPAQQVTVSAAGFPLRTPLVQSRSGAQREGSGSSAAKRVARGRALLGARASLPAQGPKGTGGLWPPLGAYGPSGRARMPALPGRPSTAESE